nr:DapH/DapD/GlmU-related protein [uncultured Noviherbaspirillum sp.]
MADATALFSDGLDLLAEFLARSRAVDDGIDASYDQLQQWHAAAAELARWSGAAGNAIVLDQSALRITVPPDLWNQLYARALGVGREVAPDRTGVATRGVGGMLAALSRLPAMAAEMQHSGTEIQMDGVDDAPWLLLPWAPLKALLLRDRLLAHEATRPRPLLGGLPASVARFDAAAKRHGMLVQHDGQLLQLLCPVAWSARIAGELGRHFTESVLLLFRLMFHGPDQGWGWDPASAQCAGLLALIDDAEDAGLADFGDFRDCCARLAAAIGGDQTVDRDALMAEAVAELAALWPAAYLQPGHPSCSLMAGWMTQVHPEASIAPDALLGPGVAVGCGCEVGAGAVLQNGASVAPRQVVPPGVVIGAGAAVDCIALSGNALPPGTLLCGSVILYRKVSIGRQVTLGHDAEIGFGVTIPDGVQVAAGARVYALRLGACVRLPAGTVIGGNLTVEQYVGFGRDVRIGANVVIRRGAIIGDGVCLPSDTEIAAGACMQRCAIATGARLDPGVIIHGDLSVGARARIGAIVNFGANAAIGPGVAVPAGVTVQAGAHIGMLELHGSWLPPGTVLGGNLRMGRHCQVGSGVVFEGDNVIGSHLDLPDGLRIARGARIQRLVLDGASVPAGTVVCGNVVVAPGARIGRGVTFEAGVVVKAASVPDGVTVMRRAVVNHCDVAGAKLPRGTCIGGDLYLAPGVELGRNVRLHKGVRIHCACRIPDGVMFLPEAIVDWFQVAPGVVLPPGTRVAGSICLKRGVVIGAGVTLGAGTIVENGVRIPNGAQLARSASVRQLDIARDASLPGSFTLYGDAVLGAGAVIGERVVLGAHVEVGPGVALPPGVTVVANARIASLRIAADVRLPDGTRLGGDLVLRHGVRVGQDVTFGAAVDVGPHVLVPDGVLVAPGARVRVLSVAAGVLPGHDVWIHGDLSAAAGARVAPGVRLGDGVVLEAGCSIGSGVGLPAGVIVEGGSRVNCIDIAAGVRLPPQTRIAGDLQIAPEVLVGRRVCFGHDVCIGPGIVLPDDTVLMDHARVNRLDVAGDAICGAGLTLCGDAVIGAGATIDGAATLGHGAVIGAGVTLPRGCVVASHALVRMLRLGAGVQLPEEFSIAGDLCLEDGVQVGERVQFGAGVVVGAGVVIGPGAVLGDNVVVCAAAVIGAHACVAALAAVDAGGLVGSGEFVQCALPAADAHFACWQAYLSPGAAFVEAPQLPAANAPPPSAPVDIPMPAAWRPQPGYVRLPGPRT